MKTMNFICPCWAMAFVFFMGIMHIGFAGTPSEVTAVDKPDTMVASYYFPNYHPNDPRNRRLGIKEEGWSEWELVKQAKPRFPGHQQPKVPQWGYTDESNPQAMAQKIDAAADHGIGAFIFDWCWYGDGPYLQRALDEGFLGAPNVERLILH